MSITLSDSAAARVNTFLANRGKGFGLWRRDEVAD